MQAQWIRRTAAVGAIIASSGFAFWYAPAPHVSAQVSVINGIPTLSSVKDTSAAASLTTATPIKHLVVIFGENNSFDHYFATYPKAANPAGEPAFYASPSTPSVNGLTPEMIANNPNAVHPFRLTRAQALTCDQNHDYTPEQQAFNGGLMDGFLQYTDTGGSTTSKFCPKGITMGYYDGNTVTALWNYAQHYALNDNSFGSTFGPSTPGALNLIAGTTGNLVCGGDSGDTYNSPGPCSPTSPPATSAPTGTPTGTITGDPDQYYDDCSLGSSVAKPDTSKKDTAAVVGRNIGDMLNSSGISWGWFNGGFADCTASHALASYDQAVGLNPATDKTLQKDYSAHHEPFQYFASTSNPHHLPPSSSTMIGKTDQANHQYDLTNFWTAADAGNLPAVSYLKAPRSQDGHPSNSDPLDEQTFLVNTINHLQSLPSWNSTAVLIMYDDSDGWYDHVMGPIVNHSATPQDSHCGTTNDGAPARCGYGPRMPFLVISPYARSNFVDNTLTDQSSALKFVEDNWLGGQRVGTDTFDNKAGSILNMFNFSPLPNDQRRIFLDPTTGQVIPNNGAVEITFSSANPGNGAVYFGPGPKCAGLVEVATQDFGAGTTSHRVLVSGNDLPGTVGNIGLTPGTTYSYEVTTTSSAGNETDNNAGACYTFTVPSR